MWKMMQTDIDRCRKVTHNVQNNYTVSLDDLQDFTAPKITTVATVAPDVTGNLPPKYIYYVHVLLHVHCSFPLHEDGLCMMQYWGPMRLRSNVVEWLQINVVHNTVYSLYLPWPCMKPCSF